MATVQLKIHMRWWVRPYVFGCKTFALLTGTEPDAEKIIDRISQRGLYYIDSKYRTLWLEGTCYVFSMLLLWYSAILELVTNGHNGDTGAYIFGCMFLILGYVFKIYRSNR